MIKIYKFLINLSLRRKFQMSFISIILVSGLIFLLILNFASQQINSMDVMLKDYNITSIFLQSFREERSQFSYINSKVDGIDLNSYEKYRKITDTAVKDIEQLEDWDSMRHLALRNAILSSFGVYRNNENILIETYLNTGNIGSKFIIEYYSLEKQAEYLIQYASQHLEESVKFGVMRYQEVIDRYKFVKNLMYITIVISLFYILIVSRFLQNGFIQPIINLEERAQRIIGGSFEINPQEGINNDEIGNLVKTFDIMEKELHRKINYLAEKAIVERELRHRQVENEKMEKLLEQTKFAQLQSQMNPHFLFNSLNTIYSLAMIEEAPKTKEMISLLSEFYRYTLETDTELVTIAEELEIVKKYMKIQEYRFSDRIQLEVSGEIPELMIIPKFILQPIVENSVIHGLSPKAEGGKVRIKFKTLNNQFIQILILDNGVGIHNNNIHSGKTSIGLKNIESRLKIYDTESQMLTWYKKNLGTIVTIKIRRSER